MLGEEAVFMYKYMNLYMDGLRFRSRAKAGVPRCH